MTLGLSQQQKQANLCMMQGFYAIKKYSKDK